MSSEDPSNQGEKWDKGWINYCNGINFWHLKFCHLHLLAIANRQSLQMIVKLPDPIQSMLDGFPYDAIEGLDISFLSVFLLRSKLSQKSVIVHAKFDFQNAERLKPNDMEKDRRIENDISSSPNNLLLFPILQSFPPPVLLPFALSYTDFLCPSSSHSFFLRGYVPSSE